MENLISFFSDPVVILLLGWAGIILFFTLPTILRDWQEERQRKPLSPRVPAVPETGMEITEIVLPYASYKHAVDIIMSVAEEEKEHLPKEQKKILKALEKRIIAKAKVARGAQSPTSLSR